MSKEIKVRVKFSPGVKGVPILKLAQQMEKMADLAQSVASDLGIGVSSENWVAEKFRNSSCAFDLVCRTPVEDEDNQKFQSTFNSVISFNPRTAKTVGAISRQTVDHAVAFAGTFDEDEIASVSLSTAGRKRPKTVKISKNKLLAIADLRTEVQSYYGSVMGTLYGWTRGAPRPFVNIRDITSSELIKCIYKQEDHQKILSLFAKEGAIIIVTGTIKYDNASGKTEITEATDFEFAPEFNEEAYNNFFGMIPDITGGLDSAEYIRRIRGGDN